MASRAEFLALLSREFYPGLRAQGFKGSGATLRRFCGEVVQVVNIQGSTDADRCYLNLGAHLTFLPTVGGCVVELASIKEYDCLFRTRVDPPEETGYAWPYGRNPIETAASARLLIEGFRLQAEPFFTAVSDYPGWFERLTLDDLRPPSPWSVWSGGNLLAFARIALHRGEMDRAREIASLGLEETPPYATGARKAYERVLRGEEGA